jgi:small neutral amino acid transporter SnatA (MarC family)
VSFGLLVLAFSTVVNPARVRLALRNGGDDTIAYSHVLAGVMLVFGATVLVAAFADTLTAALHVSPETFALSAAAVIAVLATRTVVFPNYRDLPRLRGWRAALIPAAIPLLFTPALFMLTIAAASLESTGEAVGAAAVAFLLVAVGVLTSRRTPWTVAVSTSARLIALGAVVAAVAIAFEAIYNV